MEENKIYNFDEYLKENVSPEKSICLPPPTMPHTVLILQTILKLAHWQTYSFAQHEALGKIYDEVSRLGDELVEVYIGKYGNRNVLEGSVIGLMNVTPETIGITADTLLGILNMACVYLLKEEDTEIINIVDEIRAQLNKLKFLFTLK